ncbi:MAG: TIGR02996 domain-containing protein [Kofleriaceae bacterium]
MSLLEEILANPDDDDLRRIYADTLGEDPRAEFIGIQCELAARSRNDPDRQALEQRERELLRSHGPRWVEALNLPSTVIASATASPVENMRGPLLSFSRGFPDQLKTSAGSLDMAALAQTPLRRLVVTDIANAYIPELGKLELPQLVSLRLRDGQLDPTSLEQLGSSPLLEGIRTFTLHRVGFDCADLARGRFPDLDTLELDGCRHINNQALTTAPWLPALLALEIRASDDRNLMPILMSRMWRDLETLVLEAPIADADLGALASAHIMRNLQKLDIDSWHFGRTAAQAFEYTRRATRLLSFTLRCPSTTDTSLLARVYGARFKRR